MTDRLLETAIFARTSTWPDLTMIIGDRWYPNGLPEVDEEDDPVTYPAGSFMIISDPDISSTHDDTGPAELARPRVQFDIYAEDPDNAKLAREYLKDCWENFRGVIGDFSIYRVQRIDGLGAIPDQGSGLHHEIVEFYFWHKRPEGE